MSHWKEGETLFQVRSFANHLYILKSGSVLLCFPNGRALALRKPGQVIGWSSLVNPFRHTATGVCLTDVDLYEFPREEIYRLIQMDSNFGQSLMQKVMQTMNERKPYHRTSG
jgi:CRP-like cAMP-binding protein